ncbi:hypothetical protein GTP45_07405 [Pseudoduganella sp. FT55W]|uniref:Uncharacterized protein n=1 Tax=Duganella rivi TaxID=2666083 RepID=A0A7X4GNA7_9BURK|nr:hypothetical protein [Duganella rivi]MYM66657.1 hypothetical protein [Duganella rivi]
MTDTAIDMTAAPQTHEFKNGGKTMWKRQPIKNKGWAIQAPASAGAEFSLTMFGLGEQRIGSNYFKVGPK